MSNLLDATKNNKHIHSQIRKFVFIHTFLLLLFFLSGYISFAQATLLTQNFEGDANPPGDWTIVSVELNNTWSVYYSSANAQSGNYFLGCSPDPTYPNNAWAIAPAVSLMPDVTYRLTYWYAATDGSTEKMRVTIGNGNAASAQSTILREYSSISNINYIQGVDTFRVPASGNYNLAFQCYSRPGTNGLLRLDNIVLQQLSPCSGTPAISNTLAPAEICSATPFTLSLSESYLQSGYHFQWQSSPAGTDNFANIADANAQSLTTTQLESKVYRCIVTCANSGSFTIFKAATVSTPPFPCYCKPTSIWTAEITNVKFGSINNASSGYTNNGYVDYTKTIASASIKAGTRVPINVTVSYASNVYVGVWIDYDHSQTFDTSEFTLLTSNNTAIFSDSISLPLNIYAGPITMRIRARYGAPLKASDACLPGIYGETEDYTVNIIPAKVSIFFTPFTDSLYISSIALTANIKQSNSFGINNTDSLKPRLWVKKYNANAWTVVKGNLVSGTLNDGNWQFLVNHDSLGIRRNGCDSVQFYFVAQDADTAPSIGYAPEQGATHSNVLTQITPPSKPFGYRLIPRLEDTLYVSASDCRFQSLTNNNGLFQYINDKKLDGDLTIFIGSDLAEQGIHSITSAGLNGHRLIINPDTAALRTIVASGNSVVTLKLDGVKNVMVDGRYKGPGSYLTFRNQTTNYSDTASNIKIYNGCENITIRNVVFEHSPYLSYSTNSFAIWLASGVNKNITIRENNFQNVQSTAMPSDFILSTDGSSTASVINNAFNNFVGAGIHLKAPAQNWIIDSNQFFRSAYPSEYSYNFSAIRVYGGGHQIRHNYIGGRTSFAGGNPMRFVNNPAATVSGIETHSATAANNPVLITDNRIDNLTITYTLAAQTATFNGILADESNAIIRNNVIGNPSATSSTIRVACDYAYGISAYGAQPVVIEENTVTGIEPIQGSPNEYGVTSLYGIWKANTKDGFVTNNAPAIIAKNTIYNLKNLQNRSDFTTGGTAGILVKGGSSNRIERNTIHDLLVGNDKVSGIYFSECTGLQPSSIERNRIYNLTNTSTAQVSCCSNDDFGNGVINGIAVESEKTFLQIANNQIALNNNSLSNPVTIRGIYEGLGNNPDPQQRILYNSIYIGGTASGNAGSAALFSSVQPVKQIYNNLFYNERSGGTTRHFAVRIPTADVLPTLFAKTITNHNLYLLPDTSSFAQWGQTTSLNWGAWKTKIAGDDSSFVFGIGNIPAAQLFMDKANGNLNIAVSNPHAWKANNKALPIAGIADDFDSSNVRTTSPVGKTDIGADEFDPFTPDPTTVCGCQCRQFTAQTIAGAIYNWQVDAGSGFVSLTDNAKYTGTSTPVLKINNASNAWYGYRYRCAINANGVISYTNTETLTFLSVWTGIASTAWNDPGNWSCNVVPEKNTDVVINAGLQNYPVINENITVGSLYVQMGATVTIASGYKLTLTH